MNQQWRTCSFAHGNEYVYGKHSNSGVKYTDDRWTYC